MVVLVIIIVSLIVVLVGRRRKHADDSVPMSTTNSLRSPSDVAVAANKIYASIPVNIASDYAVGNVDNVGVTFAGSTVTTNEYGSLATAGSVGSNDPAYAAAEFL